MHKVLLGSLREQNKNRNKTNKEVLSTLQDVNFKIKKYNSELLTIIAIRNALGAFALDLY